MHRGEHQVRPYSKCQIPWLGITPIYAGVRPSLPPFLFPFQFVNPGLNSGHLFLQLFQVVPEALHFLGRGDKAPPSHAAATTGHAAAAATTVAVMHTASTVAMHAAMAVTVTHLTHRFYLLLCS